MMLNVPRLNYFVENETSETDIKSFAVILQKAYKQYRKLWNKYLDLVKKYEVDSSVRNEIQEAWEEENVLKTIHTFAEDTEFLNKSAGKKNQSPTEEGIWNKKDQSFINDISETSLFDLMLDIDDTIYQSQPKTTNVILPESPIFMQNNDKSSNCKREVSKNSVEKNILGKTETDNKSDYEKQNIRKNTFDITIPEENLDSLSPLIVQSTPVINNKFHKKNRKKKVKEACQQQFNDNEVSPEKKQTKENKIPLQALDNIATPPNISLIRDNDDQTNNKLDNNKYTFYKSYPTSNDTKLRQTKLPFYNTKKKVNDTTVTSTNETNVPITKFKQLLFNREFPAEDTVTENKTACVEKNDVICLDDVDENNETIFEDVIANSPDYKQAQFQNKNRLKLKRKSKMTNMIKASASSTNNSMQNNVCSIKKRNIAINDNNILSSKVVTDSTKKKCLIFSRDIESEKELVDKNNSKGIAYIKQNKFNELNEFQWTFGNETYFEEKTPEKNATYVNKVINKNSLRLENTGLNAVKCIDTDKSAKKGVEMKDKKGWSCWECDEYYKNEAGISDAEMQRRKNQCSRHRNAYYARTSTPPGFWDPMFPATVPDNVQQ